MKALNTQSQVEAAERTLRLTWVIVAGAVLYSVLTVTPLVLRFTPAGWELTAPILSIVVDVAVIIVVRVDTIVAQLDGDAGWWPALLRWLTGGMTLALNIGDSALRGDLVGVGVHAVAPTLLIVTAEASLKWRRAITVAVARIEGERAEAEALKTRERQAAEERSRTELREREERERADRIAEREHAAKLERERREHDAQLERERDERADKRAAAERAAAERQKREDQDREDRKEREARERVERDRKAKEAQDKAERDRRAADRQKVAAAAVSTPRPAVSTPVSTPAHEPAQPAPADEKMSEADARQAVLDAIREGRSQRQVAALTGWSTGWVATRFKEAEARELTAA
ncbi:DUF2637 domain-containing protein [Streptomyces sp. NPDC001571]